MRIGLKLFASLGSYLPAEARRDNRTVIDVEPGTTVLDVIRRQRLPEELCAIVLVDGAWVGPAARGVRVLSAGEVLAIWPPVAGG